LPPALTAFASALDYVSAVPDHAEPMGDADAAADQERHASNLELFLDLVFVFAVTQITATVSHDLTWGGVGRATLVAWLVWWQWSQLTWAGSSIDFQRRDVTRTLVLIMIPATLLVATAIPRAFGEDGPWFGVAYLAVQLLSFAMYGSEAMKLPGTRKAFLRYASVAAIAPVVVLVGAFLDHDARLIAWGLAAALGVVGALRAGGGEWAIHPTHFAERHALFVIIALGEVLIAVGTTAAGVGMTRALLVGLGTAAGGACVIWWTYFAYIPGVVEHCLRTATIVERGRLARDLFTFGHFPIVAGIIGYAVVVKHVVPDPWHALPAGDRWLLVAAATLVVGGYLGIQYRILGRLAIERVAALVVITAWCAIATSVAGVVVVGGVAAALAIMQAISWRRFRARTPAGTGDVVT
jgi:low temperature requirement protein LtrA